MKVEGGACVDCHGKFGEAGFTPQFCLNVTPEITYGRLTGEEDNPPAVPYNDETIKRAIREGLDSTGRVLDQCMPRWDMSDEDLDDIVEYLKTL